MVSLRLHWGGVMLLGLGQAYRCRNGSIFIALRETNFPKRGCYRIEGQDAEGRTSWRSLKGRIGPRPSPQDCIAPAHVQPEEIARAIETRAIIRVWYSAGERIIEPHAIGRGGAGQILLRAWQCEGASVSERNRGSWKMFLLDRMSACVMTGMGFRKARKGYRQGDRHMVGGIIAEI